MPRSSGPRLAVILAHGQRPLVPAASMLRHGPAARNARGAGRSRSPCCPPAVGRVVLGQHRPSSRRGWSWPAAGRGHGGAARSALTMVVTASDVSGLTDRRRETGLAHGLVSHHSCRRAAPPGAAREAPRGLARPRAQRAEDADGIDLRGVACPTAQARAHRRSRGTARCAPPASAACCRAARRRRGHSGVDDDDAHRHRTPSAPPADLVHPATSRSPVSRNSRRSTRSVGVPGTGGPRRRHPRGVDQGAGQAGSRQAPPDSCTAPAADRRAAGRPGAPAARPAPPRSTRPASPRAPTSDAVGGPRSSGVNPAVSTSNRRHRTT